ncbi:protein enabled homolog [Ostrinia nubilalis]|uniref:protein enabled homolog n=1 Tax=Ostrinia nubilalis TaxID=29057 RepID=UPI0030823571
MERNTESSSSLSDSDFEYLTAAVKRRKLSAPRRSPRDKLERLTLRPDDDVEELLQVVDERLHKLDSRLVRLLAWQQLQQISWGEGCVGSWSRCGISARARRAVAAALAGRALADRGAALPSALLSAADRRRIAAAVWGAPPPPPPPAPPAPVPPCDAYVRATLSPVAHWSALADRGAALPSALLSAADRRRIAAAVWGAPPPPPPPAPPAPVPPCDAYVRATLSPVAHEQTQAFTTHGLTADRGAALPSALLSAADRRRIAAAVWGAPPPPPPPAPPAPVPPCDAYVRATLSPVAHWSALADRSAALPSALLSAADRRRIAAAVWGAPPPPPPPAPPAPVPPCDAYVRATLSPVAHDGMGALAGSPVAMRRAALTVGTDSGCGLRLPACRRAAPHHATIFMDEVTRHFELINYSEWGTLVNGVLYTCDAAAASPRLDEEQAPQPLPLGSRRPHAAHRINGSLTLPMSDSESSSCHCPEREPETPEGAWEGSALLPHGALLAFGCAHYVFSITDNAPFPYMDMPDEPAL